MRAKFLLSSFLILAGMVLAKPSLAQGGAGPAALSGTVTSQREGAMEGVLVTARRDGATISTTVVSDARGRYSFPASRLPAGHYRLKIRAVGYDLSGTDAANITTGKPATANLALVPTKDLASQLTNAEWLMSMPGSDQDKRQLGDCVGCHTLNRIVESTYGEKDFERLIPLMGTFAPGSQPDRPQTIPAGPRGNRGISDQAAVAKLARFLATINRSRTGKIAYPLKTLPRPAGQATHVILTTYALPRPTAEPHDVIVSNGRVYYSDFGAMVMGDMDPVSGKVTDYTLPLLKPDDPRGTLGLQADKSGNIWISLMYQGGLARLNPRNRKVTVYSIPKQWQNPNTQESMLASARADVDGKVWTNDQSAHTFLRLDVASGTYEKLPDLKDQHGDKMVSYGIPPDSRNNLYLLEYGGAGTRIGRIDARTQKLTSWKSSFGRARPRRGAFDDKGVLWFGEYGADAVGRFDPAGEKLQEWKMPLKWSMPYDAVKANKTGDVWTGSMLNDRVTRFNPKAMRWTDYLTPEEINIRRVYFDDATNSFWAGSNHLPTIVKLEPLD